MKLNVLAFALAASALGAFGANAQTRNRRTARSGRGH